MLHLIEHKREMHKGKEKAKEMIGKKNERGEKKREQKRDRE